MTEVAFVSKSHIAAVTITNHVETAALGCLVERSSIVL